MTEDTKGPDIPHDVESIGAGGIDVRELRRLKRRIAEARARGEDTFPLVRRVVLATIAVLAKRVQRTRGDS